MWQKRSYGKNKGEKGQKHEPDSSAAKALNYMVGLLAKREHSQTELEQKALRFYTQEAVDEALTKCVENGYQSDQRYAEMLVRHMEFSCYGPIKLKVEAHKKGADLSLVSEQIAAIDWNDLAYQALTKKYSADMLMNDFTLCNKALGYLQRRGFTGYSAVAAIERLKSEINEDDE